MLISIFCIGLELVGIQTIEVCKCMSSVMPDLRLPSQSQSVTARWPVPNYAIWCDRGTRVWTTGPECIAAAFRARVEPAGSLDRKSHAQPAAQPHHPVSNCARCSLCWKWSTPTNHLSEQAKHRKRHSNENCRGKSSARKDY